MIWLDIEGDIEESDEVTTVPNSLGVCDEWWLFRLSLRCSLASPDLDRDSDGERWG
jgi:hypothetical protein